MIRAVSSRIRRRLRWEWSEWQARREARAKARLDGKSSITNRTAYLDFCAQAAADDEVFETFRLEPVYVNSLEHVSETYGAGYLAAIRRDHPDYLGERLEALRGNDRFGSPLLYEYPGIGRISPVTLRYMKVLSDIELLFGDLTSKRIVEIGVGYGGQARLIMERWSVASYTLVDLEQPLRLARRFLESSAHNSGAIFLPPDRVSKTNYDLCISNYAFSELGRKIQNAYAKSLVRTSSRGYLTCNFVSVVHGIDSLPKKKLEGLHRGTHWLPEEPLTFEGNAILVWGDQAGGTSAAQPTAPATN